MKSDEQKEFAAGRVAFKARIVAITKEIEAERTVMSVWREYKNVVEISYSQFDRYVNKFIRKKPNGNTDRATEKGKDIKEARPARAREPGQPAFVSSPTPRDDLIHPKPKT